MWDIYGASSAARSPLSLCLVVALLSRIESPKVPLQIGHHRVTRLADLVAEFATYGETMWVQKWGCPLVMTSIAKWNINIFDG